MGSQLANAFLNLISRLLEPREREVILGDLTEAGESAFRSSLAVIGLVARRQVGLWKNWRPWLAAFGLALPGSLLLMGFSVSVSRAYQQYLDLDVVRASGFHLGVGFVLLLCNLFLLAAWSWTGGFVSGAISRRTLWVTAAFSFVPCVFCLERFRIESLSRLCLLLFLPAAVWGVSSGLRLVRLRPSRALALAITVTALTIPLWPQKGAWLPNWALSWPVWYLVATARRTA
ncbi:MAG TPA: hypothetical protein VHZ07_25775 [Bryobacteraceae bacterium]|jgi:hypothetical protein|nr:hypothetical protein [Bryobacteraceae bacterium]